MLFVNTWKNSKLFFISFCFRTAVFHFFSFVFHLLFFFDKFDMITKTEENCVIIYKKKIVKKGVTIKN